MKKYLVASSLLLSSFTSPIFAEESKSFYLSIGGGLNSIGDIEGVMEDNGFTFDTNSPFQYSFAIGKEFGEWRLEFNYSAVTVTSDSVSATPGGGNLVTGVMAPEYEVDLKSYMLYGYKDFPNDSKFTTYIGAGFGFSSFESPAQNPIVGGANIPLTAVDEQLFTYGVKGGLDYQIAETTSLYSEVGYVNFASFDATATENYESNNTLTIGAGLRFRF